METIGRLTTKAIEMRIVFLFTCLLVLHSGLVAQDSLKSYVMDDIVITGQFEPQSASRSVYQVRTIAMERIQSQGANRLQDVLQTELNVRFSQDMALGESSMTLQGLGGQNIKVLIDGMPLITREGTSNSGALNQVDVNNIEKIEIVEGPMSVVYGADALAGVINIITKKPENDKLSLDARIQEETAGSEYGFDKGVHNQSMGAGYTIGKFYTQARLSHNQFYGWQGNATGRDKQWHPKNQWLSSGLVGFRNDKSNIFYKLDYLDESIQNPGVFNGGEALDQEYTTKRFNHQLQGQTRLFDKISYNGAVSLINFSRRTLTTTVDQETGDVRLALGAGLQDLSTYDGVSLRGTFQYQLSSQWTFQPGYDINLEQGEGGRINADSPWLNDYAFFFSTEYTPTDRISIRPGFRVIQNSVYQAPPAVPSINTKFQLIDNLVLRAAYARGFRAPSLRELYFNFYDASHSIEGNPDLEAELSHSVNGGLSWKVMSTTKSKVDMTFNGFYNTVNNMISYGQKPSNSLITTYINIDRFKTKGLMWNTTYTDKSLEVKVGVSYTGRYNQLIEDDSELPEFTWTPEANLLTTYQVGPAGLTFNLFYKYTGSLPNYEVGTNDAGNETIQLAKIDGYHMMDITARKELFGYLNATLGVRNLLNVTNVNNTSTGTSGTHSTGGARPIGYGRSYFLGLSFNLNK
jgi:outer membrane receptor for ferrienterochelin and colicins